MIKTIKTLTTRAAVLFMLFAFQATFGYAQVFQKLYDLGGTDGKTSYSTPISDGTYLYGMTQLGGANNYGTIYKIRKDGTGFQKLYDFDNVNGRRAYNSLTLIGSELYGVTYQGGNNDLGVLFKINTDGTNFTKILDFADKNVQYPQCSPYFDGTYLYGTTYAGGTRGGGTFYKVRPDGTDFSVLYNFVDEAVSPNWDLIFDGTYFYGSTFNGNQIGNSTIYKIKADGSDFQKLHDFPDTFSNTNVSPSRLLLHNNYLYGTTFYSETTQDGYLYRIQTDGTDFSILHNFTQATGNKPQGGLVLAGDYLYGTTTSSVMYRIKPDGTDYGVVFNFNGSNGYAPWCGLYYENASLYGVTTSGGINSGGTIFKFVTIPVSFSNISADICAGNSYNFNGNLLTNSGIYCDTLTNANAAGYDSILTLTLHVLPVTVDSLFETINQGDVYDFNGVLLNEPGVYTDTLTGINNCDSIIVLTLSVDIPTGINNITTKDALKVYPNPTNGIVYFSGPANVQVTNTLGQMISDKKNINALDLSGQPAGIYFLRLTSDNRDIFQHSKIVKE